MCVHQANTCFLLSLAAAASKIPLKIFIGWRHKDQREGLSLLKDIIVDLDLVPGLSAFGVQHSALEMC